MTHEAIHLHPGRPPGVRVHRAGRHLTDVPAIERAGRGRAAIPFATRCTSATGRERVSARTVASCYRGKR